MNDGWLRITTKTRKADERLVGATFSLWGLPFYLNLISEPISWDSANLMRHTVKMWFSTYDNKRRQVKSHRVTLKYPDAEYEFKACKDLLS